jgi:hypothetical protein
VLLLFASHGAWAITIFDSLGQPTPTPDPIPVPGGTANAASLQVYNTQEGCQEFVTDNSTYFLKKVTIALDDGVSGGLGAFNLGIWDSSGTDFLGTGHGAPGVLLTTLVGSSDPFAGGDYAFTPTGLFTLQPDTSYFVVASTPAFPANYPWLFTTDNSPAIGSGWWGFDNYDGNGWYMGNVAGQGAFNPQLMDVDADRVPEPGTMALLLTGLPIGLLWRKRRA